MESHDTDAHELTTDFVLPRPRREVFRFFGNATNLEEITPPSLRFEVLTPEPIEMAEGTLLDYKLRLRGVPFRWRTEITAWEPPFRFVDEQLRGPYRLWVHEHTFEEVAGGTRVRDRVRYALPLAGWPGAGLVHRFFVRPEVEEIFDYRQKKMEEIFGIP